MLTGEKVNVPATLLEKYPVLKELAENLGKGQKNIFENQIENEKKGGDSLKAKTHPGNNN